ncbi:MAG: hypothetical protein KBD78_08385 [Oligoflexales bacterium]|nr:hypothetical protein [Oligoflexales bacterium]
MKTRLRLFYICFAAVLGVSCQGKSKESHQLYSTSSVDLPSVESGSNFAYDSAGCEKINRRKIGIMTGFTYMDGAEDILSHEYVDKTVPALIKIMDNVSHAKAVKMRHPCMLVIARLSGLESRFFNVISAPPAILDENGELLESGVQAAKNDAARWIRKMNEEIEKRGIDREFLQYVDFIEGLNEPGFEQTPNNYRFYAEFEAERVRLMAEEWGKRACVGNFSVGKPEVVGELGQEIWLQMVPLLDAVVKFKGAMCVHEYIVPEGEFDRLPVSISNDPAGNWYTLRYLRAKELIKQNQLAQQRNQLAQQRNRVARPDKKERPFSYGPDHTKINWIISEFGIDRAGNPDQDGWKAQLGEDLKAKCHYMSLISSYETNLFLDEAVLGATLFAYEIPQWKSFDLTPLIEQKSKNTDDLMATGMLVEYLNELHAWKKTCFNVKINNRF